MFSPDKIPSHVGIIMDGNGRWAKLRGLPRFEGHIKGAERAKEIIEASLKAGIKNLTLYTFSMENWQRPADEIDTLMKLLEFHLRGELSGLMEKNVRFKAIGEIWRLPEGIRSLVEETEAKTSNNNRMTLITALSYGGRNEIVRAVKKMISSGIEADKITEELFESFLDTKDIPPPDLIIRTSNERRLSNFLLWQGAYAELYFTETLWPDFTEEEFFNALKDYQMRERRFGGISPARTQI